MTPRELMLMGPVLPVIVIERLQDAVPLARALVAGGVRVLEITLRTPVALDAMAAISAEVPDALVGAGSVMKPADLANARAAGACFALSPGADAALLAAGRESGMPFIPGVMTPSEVIAGLGAGYREFKLFPAAQAGGIGMLKAMAGPFPKLMFCPTGGITQASAPEFLLQPNVACVGGSWLAPASMVKDGDWASITQLARQAAALR